MISKIVQHPNSRSPQATVAEALGIAQAGGMTDCCVMFADQDGVLHIAWHGSNSDLAAYAVVLSRIAADRLIAD